ncbi:hypothetical protein EMCG_08589 [[Emmonsia] crescens]|uniref:Secreted protein n=1 Tax=[Emmonsia] crescens TaxID=73230 RepID=A0A0G2I4M6_9EURO|nr:hypothetical protein EMCG_08589 [Emmonsia crescens UAMH 3008]
MLQMAVLMVVLSPMVALRVSMALPRVAHPTCPRTLHRPVRSRPSRERAMERFQIRGAGDTR